MASEGLWHLVCIMIVAQTAFGQIRISVRP